MQVNVRFILGALLLMLCLLVPFCDNRRNKLWHRLTSLKVGRKMIGLTVLNIILTSMAIILAIYLFFVSAVVTKKILSCVFLSLPAILMILFLITELKWFCQTATPAELVSGHYREKCFDAMKADKLEEAQNFIAESIKYNETHFKNWLLLARIAAKQDDCGRAKEHIVTAAEKLGPDPTAKDMAFFKEQHGIILALLDDFAQAIELMHQAQKLDHSTKREEMIGKLEAYILGDEENWS
jgi:energy-coupling factor transporter transmembrane protein EcfT